MCCSLDQINGKLIIQTIAIEKNDKSKAKALCLKGIYDRSPKTLADRMTRFFQNLELLEKIAEIVDEFFHLFGSTFQRYTNLMVYQNLRHLHHAAHDIEHVIHNFCLAGDITSIFNRKFIMYHDHKCTQIDYLRTISRVCHTTAHFFASAQFLHELKLCSLDRFEKAFKYGAIFNALGYILTTISLVWQKHKGIANDQFSSELGIHLGGSLFEMIHLANRISTLAHYGPQLNKLAAFAGIIHAWNVVQRLMPKDKEEFAVHLELPEDELDDDQLINPHHHDEHCVNAV